MTSQVTLTRRESVGGVENICVSVRPCARPAHGVETSFHPGMARVARRNRVVPGGVVRESPRTTPASGKPEPDAGEGSERRDGRSPRATAVFWETRLSGAPSGCRVMGSSPRSWTRQAETTARGFARFPASGPGSGNGAPIRRGWCFAKGAVPGRKERPIRLSRRRAFRLSRRRECLRGTHGVGRKA